MNDRRPLRIGWTWFLASMAVVAVVALLIAVKPMTPNTTCCDHLFYRAQAVEWTGIDRPEMLQLPPGNELEKVYDQYYVDPENGLTRQPPYVYRVLVPAAAGILGHVMDVDAAFYLINAVSLMALALLSGAAVWLLTGSRWASATATVTAPWLPAVGPFFAWDYMLVDATAIAVVAAVLLLALKGRYLPSLLLAACVAPLVKETLTTLALCVVVLAFIRGHRRGYYWALAALPILIQLALRIGIAVPAPPALREMYIPGDPYLFVTALSAAFAVVGFLAAGMMHPSVRQLSYAFTPLFVLLAVITSSTLTDGPRIWLAAWPVVLVAGVSGLWRWSEGTFWWWIWMGLLAVSVALGAQPHQGPAVVTVRTAVLLAALAALVVQRLTSVERSRERADEPSGQASPATSPAAIHGRRGR